MVSVSCSPSVCVCVFIPRMFTCYVPFKAFSKILFVSVKRLMATSQPIGVGISIM